MFGGRSKKEPEIKKRRDLSAVSSILNKKKLKRTESKLQSKHSLILFFFHDDSYFKCFCVL